MGGELYVNGKVFTGEGETHFASAFRITDGAFSWVGDSSDVAGGDAVDLRGRTVLPGFLDVHTHPAFMSMLIDAVACLPPAVNNIPELIAALKTHKDFGAGAERWIEGWGYDESKLAERRKPTAQDLDPTPLRWALCGLQHSSTASCGDRPRYARPARRPIPA